jgi:hypothetical protein
LQVCLVAAAPQLSMVEPILHSTFGTRVGHENLSSETTAGLQREGHCRRRA